MKFILRKFLDLTQKLKVNFTEDTGLSKIAFNSELLIFLKEILHSKFLNKFSIVLFLYIRVVKSDLCIRLVL
ncbi:hypothetical protein LEP1GSC198_2208 [Leptospira kirschneri str. JB]|nr:hypothetical protein LEP1GSC198_2208 [Leptospira kirschneri str. JB]